MESEKCGDDKTNDVGCININIEEVVVSTMMKRNGTKWSQKEKELLLRGLRKYGRNYENISKLVLIWTIKQIDSFTRKYIKSLGMTPDQYFKSISYQSPLEIPVNVKKNVSTTNGDISEVDRLLIENDCFCYECHEPGSAYRKIYYISSFYVYILTNFHRHFLLRFDTLRLLFK